MQYTQYQQQQYLLLRGKEVETMIGMGSKVMLNDKGRYAVLKEDEGKIFEVRSNQFEICGAKCVLLKGKQGGYAVDALIEVEEEKERTGKWIPCSERLPENISTVIVQVKEIAHPTFGWYEDMDKKWILTERAFVDLSKFSVIAWQPMPESYKPGGEGEE